MSSTWRIVLCNRRSPYTCWLVGCFGFLKLLSLLWQQVKFRRYKTIDDVDYDAEDEESGVIISKSSRCSEFVLSGFLLAWFLCGNYWVLGIWKPHFNQLLNEPSNWCDKTVYLFAFVQIIVCYAVLATGILLTILLSICQRIVSSKWSNSNIRFRTVLLKYRKFGFERFYWIIGNSVPIICYIFYSEIDTRVHIIILYRILYIVYLPKPN